ncbi:hypothetical protein [Salinibaculum salinum]|uniref:hypothetical protein n=1 Tax=Salinibaculum salinum TaxID=3131996 RepID=UPI0030EDD3A3
MSTTDPPSTDQKPVVQAIADKSTPVALLLAVFISPVAYYYVGRTKLAIVNFLTLNYLLLGIVIVPIHVYKIISDAESEIGDQRAR